MTRTPTTAARDLTAAELILLAAAELVGPHAREVLIEHLAVRAWQMAPRKFGLRYHETAYPDVNRVKAEVYRKGSKLAAWFRPTGENRFALTEAGQAAARRLNRAEES